MRERILLTSLAAFGSTVVALAFSCVAFASPARAQNAGHCLSFDGVQQFVHVPRSVSLEPDLITIEMWARLDGPQDWNSRLLRKGEHDAYFITADQDLDQRMQLLITHDTSVLFSAEDVFPHTAYIGTWRHFVGVYALDHAEFWVDGARRSYVPHALGVLRHLPLTDLFIGCGLPVPLQNEFFAGRIDEVRIWNVARTQTEIEATWNRSLVGDEAGLVAYWRFDEGAGQVLHDSSLYANEGELGFNAGHEPSDPLWVLSDVPLAAECGDVSTYCASAINTTGQGARIGWFGSSSIADRHFVLTVRDVPPHHPGVFFFGRYQTQSAFGEGLLCVTGEQRRLRGIVSVDAFGRGEFALDFEDPLAPEVIIAAGSEWNFQFWYRDPQPVGHGFNLSDALNARFCP